MAVVTTTYATSTAITLGLHATPLASSPTFVLGRESTQIDNTTNKYIDAIVHGRTTVGTTPTTATLILCYVWGADDSLGTTALDVLDGTDSDETFNNVEILQSGLRLAASISVIATDSNVTYYFAPFSVASLFGGVMPKYWGLYVSHNTGVALNSTAGNHVFKYTGITYTST